MRSRVTRIRSAGAGGESDLHSSAEPRGRPVQIPMTAICPKCGWETRELIDEEVELVHQGRLRCSGKCQETAVPGNPLSFPPKLKMKGEETNGGN